MESPFHNYETVFIAVAATIGFFLSWVYHRYIDNLDVDTDSAWKVKFKKLEQRRILETQYYTTVIHNLETTNKAVQEEAQGMRVSSTRLRNLYDRNASFMSREELEKNIVEVSRRIASMRSALETIKSKKTITVKECSICTYPVKCKTKCVCKNEKCSYEWCKSCDIKLKSNGLKYCPAGCQGAI